MSNIVSPEAQHGIGHFFTNQFGESFLYEVNGAVFNVTGSAAAYKKYYGEQLFNKDSLYLFIGSDSGLLMQYVRRVGVPEGSHYIFIEPEPIYEKIQEHYNLDETDQRTLLCTPDNWLDKAKSIGLDRYIFSQNVHIIRSFAARDAFYENYPDMARLVEDEYRAHGWALTNNSKIIYFINRQLDNLAELHTPFDKLRNAYLGKSCVILAGGPSLDESIDWIKTNQDKVIIFAVSRIARKLIQENIKPDFIVSVDSKHGSFDIGKDMLSFWKDSIFIQAYHADNYLTAQWRGKAVYLGQRLPWDCKLNEPNMGVSGPTVTQTSLSSAIGMGFSQIVLCGVDHCYSPEGYTHTKNTDEHDIGPQHSHFGVTIETNGGGIAETKEEFKAGINAIEKIVNRVKESGQECRVINPSKNSARIPGVEHIPLEDLGITVALSSTEKDIYALLPDRTNDDRIADLTAVLAELAKMKADINTVKKLSYDALKHNKNAHKNLDIESKKKVDKIEAKLHQKYLLATALVTNYNAPVFLKNTIVDDSREFSMTEIRERVDIYFNNLIDSSKMLIDKIMESEERIRSRIEECKASPEFEKIFTQWDKDNTPGRALLLSDFHKDDHHTLDSAKEQIESYIKKFDQLLHESATDFRQALEDLSNDIDVVKQKANYLLKNKDLPKLENLADSLHKHKTGENWKEIIYLVDAYRNELAGNTDLALENFQQLLESNYQIDALKHILHISIANQDHMNALLALECLSGTLPIYMPFYAEMLHLTGQNSDAINTYTEYLKQVPEDISVWLKLGKLYMDLNVLDSAKWVFEQVKIIDPDNTAVDSYLSQLQVH